MKQLNIICSFVFLSFYLFINVSFADIVANYSYLGNNAETTSSVDSSSTYVEGYTYSLVDTILTNYVSDTTNETYINDFNNMIFAFENSGKNVVVFRTKYSSSNYACIATYDSDVNVCFGSPLDRIGFILDDTSQTRTFNLFCNRKFNFYNITCTAERPYAFFNTYQCYEVYYVSTDIYQLTQSSSLLFSWDGTSYYYKAPIKPEPETPTMPTNSEIASAVQMFYNSDLYKNNTNFKDFMVVYSFSTGYYSFIGTDNHLLQEIYYDGAKPSNDDFTYSETWWRFYNYLGNIQNFFYGSNYWLYSTLKVDDVLSPIKYDGVGKLNNLFNLKFTAQSVIVYSSYEYEVYEYWPPESDYEIETGTNKKEVTTIPGDQYTYDETLDPTDSGYSPIQNYIPVNPSQTIISDVDVSEINKTFEENKGILNIENASWLFTANNKLISYFIGFLSLLIVFLIISRALGG